jgi:O-antigen/teichoic acid export membrane protein
MEKQQGKSASFLRQTIIYGLGLALNYGIGFILLPVYSRLMPEADYGRLEVLNRKYSTARWTSYRCCF